MGESMRKSKKFRPTLNDKLEDRTVPSYLGGFSSSPVLALHSGFGDRGGGSLGSGFGFQGGGYLGAHQQPGGVTASSSTLSQDARQVQQDFRTLDGSFLAAVAALRTTATTMTGPTTAGLTAYNSAIASAISALNSSIGTTLSSNLPNTGTGVISTISGYTSTLQSELESAGKGLASSTNQALLALTKEAKSYIRNALNQITTAILSDQPAGSITASTVQTYKQAVRTADNAFILSISNAVQTAIAGSTQLDSTTVSSDVSTLQTAVASAINGLGTQFTSSTYNPTSTITTQLTTLENQLLAIPAPTAGSNSSARLFSRTVFRTVFSDVAQSLSTINTTDAKAIQDYNNSLL